MCLWCRLSGGDTVAGASAPTGAGQWRLGRIVAVAEMAIGRRGRLLEVGDPLLTMEAAGRDLLVDRRDDRVQFTDMAALREDADGGCDGFQSVVLGRRRKLSSGGDLVEQSRNGSAADMQLFVHRYLLVPHSPME